MKKFSIMICLVSALLLGMASCGDSQQKRLRLSKQEKARLDSIDRASLKVGVMPTLVAHHLLQRLGNLHTAYVHTHTVSLHHGSRTIAVDNETRQVMPSVRSLITD